MLREVLRGKSNLSARERFQYPELNRKDALRLLSTRKQSSIFDENEVITSESLRAGMEIFYSVQTQQNYDEVCSEIDDYSLLCHCNIAQNLVKCDYEWLGMKYQLQREKYLQRANTENQLNFIRIADNAKNLNAVLPDHFMLNQLEKTEYIRNLFEPTMQEEDIEESLAGMIVGRIAQDFSQQDRSEFTLIQEDLIKADLKAKVNHPKVIQDEILSTRKELWNPQIFSKNPKKLMQRIIYEEFLNDVIILDNLGLQKKVNTENDKEEEVLKEIKISKNQDLRLDIKQEQQPIRSSKKFGSASGRSESKRVSLRDLSDKKSPNENEIFHFTFTQKQDYPVKIQQSETSRFTDQIQPFTVITDSLEADLTPITSKPHPMPLTARVALKDIQNVKLSPSPNIFKDLTQYPLVDNSLQIKSKLKLKKSVSPSQKQNQDQLQRLNRVINQTLSLRQIRQRLRN
ncbi:UNKNOWN [Stylonychia lemnae]|uniref:Uncharacterized protein n=1 Tax=Stylonychia lemnae TaxID=5949 RepID=A0A078B937_STYLE|nr:UNKNOWN [Stylonychia lemnae]|eukprot:CDW91030.1 UNKNOWN [Stylonychia lemnae]